MTLKLRAFYKRSRLSERLPTKLVGQVVKVVGGGGGGKPTMAQAGGKEPSKLGAALGVAQKLASELLEK